MKKLLFILPVVLTLYSCDSGGMNPRDYDYIYHIFSINTAGSDLHKLSNGSYFIPSQTGDSIFYLENKSVYSIKIDGTSKHLITPSYLQVYDFRLSPSGKKLFIGEHYNPYIINTDGSNLTKLDFLSEKSLGSWAVSKDGKRIVYSSSTGIYIANTDGTNLRLLRDSSNSSTYSNISFTLDQNSIIYMQNAGYNDILSLKLYKISNSRDTTLFPQNGGNHIINYEISPWNTLLLVSSGGIYILDLNTLKYTLITRGAYGHYSKDGNSISYKADYTNDIYIYNLKTKNSKLVPFGLSGKYKFIEDPYLSPDNSHVIFEADSLFYY